VAQSQSKIDLFKVYMSEKAPRLVEEVLRSGFIGQGPVVEKFENVLRNRFNQKNLVTLNSGTSSLHLALHLIKADNPDIEIEVLTTALTCTATNWPILANGLKLKWVDIDPTTLNIDLVDLENKITDKTRVIMLVHWGGYPNDLDKVKEIQDRTEAKFGFRPLVIEDCAHAFGSSYKGRPIGSTGDNFCAFSFQAIKHFTTVDGGMLTLPDSSFERRARLIRWYGIDRESNRKDFRCEDDIPEWGYKFHMNDVNAAVGLANIEEVDYVIDKHKRNAHFYDECLKGSEGVSLLKREEGFNSSFWIYSLLVENRDGFMRHMANQGIAVSQVHERNDKHSCVRDFKSPLPNLDATIGKVVSIPVGWWVTPEDTDRVVSAIKMGW